MSLRCSLAKMAMTMGGKIKLPAPITLVEIRQGESVKQHAGRAFDAKDDCRRIVRWPRRY
jgi:hypothetical protein